MILYNFNLGDVLNGRILDSFASYLPSHCQVYNLYGPTETTITATYHLIDFKHDSNTISCPIGRPLRNYQCDIVDKCQQVVPIGHIGELIIRGPCVFQGYFTSKDMTEQVPDNRSSDIARSFAAYRTGDLCRMDKWGVIHFIGRQDFQIKIRGQRLEIGEIERVIFNSSSHITNCVVEKFEDDHLLAYVESSDRACNEPIIKDYCQKYLPKYMLPSFFILIEKFPLNSNGKLDRKQLPILDQKQLLLRRAHDQRSKHTMTHLEKDLHYIYLEALNLPTDSDLNMDASLIELGGTSLTVMKVLGLIRKRLYSRINVSTLLTYSSIHQISQKIEPFVIEQQQQKPSSLKQTTPEKKELFPSPSLILESLGILFLMYHYFFSWHMSTALIQRIEQLSSPQSILNKIFGYILFIPTVQLVHYLLWKYLLFPWGIQLGEHKLYSWTYYRWWFLNRLWRINSRWLYCLLGTPMYNMYLRLCGAQVGECVHINTTLIDIPDLIELHDSIYIAADVVLNSVTHKGNRILFQKIKIGSYCSIGCCSVLYEGVQMDSHVLVQSMSSVSGHIHPTSLVGYANLQQPHSSSQDENKMKLNRYQYFYQISAILIVLCLQTLSIYLPFCLYTNTSLSLWSYCIILPLCWMMYQFICVVVTLILLIFVIGRQTCAGQYALNSWYILHHIWLRHLIVSSFGYAFQRLFDVFHPIYPRSLSWLGAKIDLKTNTDVKIAEFPYFLYFPCNLLTIESQLTTFSQVRLVSHDVDQYGQCDIGRISVGSQSTIGNNSVVHPGSQIPPLTMVGAMTRYTFRKNPDISRQEDSSIVLGIPGQWLPGQITSSSIIGEEQKRTSDAIIYRSSMTSIVWLFLIGCLITQLVIISRMITQRNALLTSICFMLLYAFLLCFVHNLSSKYIAFKNIIWLQLLKYYLFNSYHEMIGHFISGTQWLIFLLRGLNARIGRSVIITDITNIPDPQLTLIGDNVRIGYGAIAQVSYYSE